MEITPFKLERYFAEYEFKARYLLSASDCEALSLADLLALADAEALGLWQGLGLSYTESQGHPLLRAAIARQYQQIAADDVLVAAPEEAIFIAMHALLAPGDQVIVTWPAYQSLYAIAEGLGARVVRWPLTAQDGSWRLDVAELAGLITPQTRLLVVNFPHNPTGYLPPRADWDAIVTLAERHGLYLFSDEMYRLLEHDPAARLPAACDLYERGISLAGLSKAFGLPGLRIGWLATRDRDVLARCTGLKDYTTICSSAPSEILGIIALRAAEIITGRNLAIVRANLAHADRFFADRLDRFQWLRPLAGSVAFPRLLAETSVVELCRGLLDQRNAMLVPGEMFDHPCNHFRLGLGRTNFPEALGVLEGYLGEAVDW